METAVNKLDAMFQKAEADLDCIEKQLKFEFMANAPENGTPQDNPVKLLENLSAIKARHKALCVQMNEIAAEQKQSVETIKANLATTIQLVKELQLNSTWQVPPLTEKEQEAAEILSLSISQSSEQTLSLPLKEQTQSKALSKNLFEGVTESQLEAVPRTIRSNLKLADVNTFYKQLFDHFTARNNSGTLSTLQMKKLNMKVSEAKLKTLKHLKLIQMDKNGNVSLKPKG